MLLATRLSRDPSLPGLRRRDVSAIALYGARLYNGRVPWRYALHELYSQSWTMPDPFVKLGKDNSTMLITGYRTRKNVLGQLMYTCDKCQQRTYHTFVRTRRSFTAFWIPLFPLAKITTTRCNVCGFQTYFDNKKADELFPQANKKATQQTPERR